ncbi:MAG: hypothetical protein ABIR56_03920, partial [Polaromonas sp.]
MPGGFFNVRINPVESAAAHRYGDSQNTNGDSANAFFQAKSPLYAYLAIVDSCYFHSTSGFWSKHM